MTTPRRAARGDAGRPAPVDRDRWIEAGLALLRGHGEGALTIERLAARVRRTKGSFYHHFRDIDAFRAALLAAWTERHTRMPIARAEAGPGSRRPRLYAVVSSLDMRLELAVRAWAGRDPLARRCRQRVDRRRVDYLAELWRSEASGGLRPPGRPPPDRRARLAAELEYATFLGLLEQHGPGYLRHTRALGLLRELLAPRGARRRPAKV